MLTDAVRYWEDVSPEPSIESVWTLEVRDRSAVALPYRTLPDGCMDLLYHVKRDCRGETIGCSLLVAGPTDLSETFLFGAGDTFAGIRFRPGWGGHCLGLSPAQVFRRNVPGEEISTELKRLKARLAGTAGPACSLSAMRQRVEEWSSSRTPRQRTLDAIRTLRSGGGRLRVEQAAKIAGLSPRTMRRELRDATGLSPKVLLRIFRFRRTLARINAGDYGSLADLAAQAGYADQSHMTREFADLGGMTPACTSS